MNNTKKIFALVMVLLIVISLCACGAKTKDKATEAPDYTGEYKFLGISTSLYSDYVVSVDEDLSVLTLNEDGTGKLTLIETEATTQELQWSVEGETLSLTVEGDTVTGTIKDGVITVTSSGIDGETNMYYAKEDADTSGLHIVSADELSRIAASEAAAD